LKIDKKEEDEVKVSGKKKEETKESILAINAGTGSKRSIEEPADGHETNGNDLRRTPKRKSFLAGAR
jgi:hypothetical protein